MEKRINIAKLLKGCPKGMELYSTIYGTVYLERVTDIDYTALIHVKTSCNADVIFYPDGKFNTYYSDSEITLFPSKNVRTWEGFVPPCKFKDGDVLAENSCIFIIQKIGDNCTAAKTHCTLYDDGDFDDGSILYFDIDSTKLASEEEKEILFKAIKDHGYKWNAETKTLEKLVKPKFKIGDKIVNNDYVVEITDIFIDDEVYGYKSKMGGIGGILFTEQDAWELVPDKFDVSTLKPFDKVLARCSSLEKWRIQFFEKFDKTCKFPFICMGYNKYTQCIPYEGNEHLLDTADSCDDYYLI